jgi:RNA polymerase sigma factor (sigma-70 family)
MSSRTASVAYVEEDVSVVGRCRRGEPGAWPEFVRRFSPYVYAIARGYRLSEEDAEDVFQEVFLRTWQRLGALRDDAAIRPWLGQLTRRLCVDRLRANIHEKARAQLEESTPAEDGFALLEDILAVRDAMARLPTMQRDILERFFVRGESQATIAASLGVAEGTVASRISRARQLLRWQLAW